MIEVPKEARLLILRYEVHDLFYLSANRLVKDDMECGILAL